MLNKASFVCYCNSHTHAVVENEINEPFLCWSNSLEAVDHSRGWRRREHPPSVVERRSASSRYSSWALATLGRHRSVLARRIPATAAPMAPSPRDQSPIPNSSASSPVPEDNTAEGGGRSKQITWGSEEVRTSESSLRPQRSCGSDATLVCWLTLCHSSRYRLTGCSCLWRACSVQDRLWLHFGETEPSVFLRSVAPLWWSAGCSGSRSAKAEQSSAGARSTWTLWGIWTEPASGTVEEKSEPVTTNTLSLKERQISGLNSPPLDSSHCGWKIPIKINVLLLKQ